MTQNTTIFKFLLYWILLVSFLSAQKVTQIKFEGLAHLSPTMAKEISGIHIGEEMDSEKINDSIKNFFSQGYFKDVWVDRQGGVLIYHFEEKVAIANIDIKGFGTGDDGKKLLEGIGLKKGDLFDERRIKKAKKALIAKLESQGYYDSVVEVEKTEIGKTSVSIVFDVNKGEKIIIKKINFVGASKVSTEDLERELANKEADTFGWMPWRNSGEAAVDQLEYDSYRVKDVFMQRGYLDAYVSKPLMRVDFGSYRAEVDYQVKEGIQYRVGTISVTQSVKGLNSETLKEDLILTSGKIFNVKRMRKDIASLEEKVGNLGYAFVKVAPQMHKDPKQKIINLEYVVDQGEIVTINDVVISGNDTTKDRVIRRYIFLAPGDTFSAKDLKDSKSALGRTGFFEAIDIQTERLAGNKINLLVKVKETSTGTISAGGGFGSFEGFMVNASVADRNIFGSGINTTLGFEFSRVSKNANLSFINPRVWDSLYSFGVNFHKREMNFIDFSEDSTGASLTLGREFMRYFHGSVGLGYADNQSVVSEEAAANPIGGNFLFNDQYSKTSIFSSVNFDNTDDFFVPRTGMKAIMNFEYGHLSGEYPTMEGGTNTYGNIVRGSGRFGTYYGLADWIDYDLILRFKARATYIHREDASKLPIAEKLFMGGMGSVRGYDQFSLSPYFLDASGHRRLVGGTERASTSLEASVPLSEAAKMRLAFFYDHGVISSDGAVIDGRYMELEHSVVARSSTGVVIEWQSAFGLINLVFSHAIDAQIGDNTAVFEFSMGAQF